MKKAAALAGATIAGCALLAGGVAFVYPPAGAIALGVLVLLGVGGYLRGERG